LESSFHAFRKSIERFIFSYEKFIVMYGTGTVYISKKVDVYDLIQSDNILKLEELVEDEKAHKYDSNDFKKEFLTKLEFDLAILREIKMLWDEVNTDPKLEKFIECLKSTAALKSNKLVVFTESKETGDYIYKALLDEFPNEV